MADSPSGSPAVLTPTSSQETLDRGDPNALADSEAPSTNGPKSESESESDAEDEKNSKTSQESENDKAKEKEKGGIKWDLPRSEVHLAFGPEKYYFLRCGSNWRFVRSNSSVWKELDILNPTWVAFKHNTGFVICGEDVDDSQRTTIVHTWNDNFNVLAKDIDAFVKSRNGYIKLFDWLCDSAPKEEVSYDHISVTIGPNGGYFARVGDKWISHALPKDLQRALDRSKTSGKYLPAHVALGLNGAWVVLWTDGTRSWDLRYTYPGLQNTRLLDDMKDGGIVFIALNAYQEDRYFLTKEDGSCTYSMTMSDNNESRIVNEMTNDYLKLRAKHDGASFTNTYTHNGRSVQAQISAEGIRLLNKRQQLVQMWKKRRGQLVDGRNLGLIGAVSGGSGLLARLGGAGALRAFSVGASAGFGAAIALLFRT